MENCTMSRVNATFQPEQLQTSWKCFLKKKLILQSMNLWHGVEISIQSLLDSTQSKCNGLFPWYLIFLCYGAHFVSLPSWRVKAHTKSSLCLNVIIHMFTGLFCCLWCHLQVSKALAPIVSLHTEQILNPAAHCKPKGYYYMTQNQNLPRIRNQQPLLTRLCQNPFIWHSKWSPGRKEHNPNGW